MTSENKFPCGAVRDLLPLYRDNVCSDESRRLVEEHLAECADCKTLLERLDNCPVEEMLSLEKSAVLDNHRKKERRTAVTAGLITAGILFVPVIVCLICNLAAGNGLSWFYLVLTSLLVVASVTVVPMLSANYRFSKMLAGFTASLFLLLLSCCVFTGGDWLWIAMIPSIFGLSLLCLPFAVRELPLPECLKNRKTLLVFSWDTLWLLLTLGVCCAYTGGDWFMIAAVSCVFGLSLVMLPFLIRQFPLPKALRNRKTLVVILWDILWLYILLGVCCAYSGGQWFTTTAIACMAGLSTVFMPLVIKQLPLPDALKNHKGLTVMLWDTLWIYALILDCSKYVQNTANYFHNSIWITTLSMLLPWSIFILIRYTKLHPLTKTGLCILLPTLFGAVVNDIIMLIFLPKNGLISPSMIDRIHEVLSGTVPADTEFIITLSIYGYIAALGIIFTVIGIVRTVILKRSKTDSEDR